MRSGIVTRVPAELVSRPTAICARPEPAIDVVVAETSVLKRISHGSLPVISSVSLKAPAAVAS